MTENGDLRVLRPPPPLLRGLLCDADSGTNLRPRRSFLPGLLDTPTESVNGLGVVGRNLAQFVQCPVVSGLGSGSPLIADVMQDTRGGRQVRLAHGAATLLAPRLRGPRCSHASIIVDDTNARQESLTAATGGTPPSPSEPK